MWKYSLVFLLLVKVFVIESLPANIQKPLENGQEQKLNEEITKNITEIAISKINSPKVINATKAEITEEANTNNEVSRVEFPSGDLDQFNFKYYWILLVFSSLAIISLLIFKSFR